MYIVQVITRHRTLRFGYSSEEMALQRMREWSQRPDVFRVYVEKMGRFILGQSMQGGGSK